HAPTVTRTHSWLHVRHYTTHLAKVLEADILKRVVGSIKVLQIGEQRLHKTRSGKTLRQWVSPSLENAVFRSFLLFKGKRLLSFRQIETAQKVVISAGNHARPRVALLFLNVGFANRSEVAHQNNEAVLLKDRVIDEFIEAERFPALGGTLTSG